MKKTFFVILILLITAPLYGQSMSRIIAEQYHNDFVAIAKGSITDKGKVIITGQNTDVGATAETLWDQSELYTYLQVAQTLRIVSKSADDDTSGTGALTVKLWGLDGDYAFLNETIGIGGADTVSTTNEFLRVWKAEVMTAGSGGVNADSIKIFNDSATDTLVALILPGQNITSMAMFTVPAGYKFYLIGFYSSQGIAKQSTVSIIAKPYGEVFKRYDTAELYLSVVQYEYPLPLVFDEKTDVEIRVVTVGASGNIAARFSGWYEPE